MEELKGEAIVTILVSIAYCLYLSRKPAALAPEKAGK